MTQISLPSVKRLTAFDLIGSTLGHSSRVTAEIYAKLTFTPETRDRYLQLFEGGAYKQ